MQKMGTGIRVTECNNRIYSNIPVSCTYIITFAVHITMASSFALYVISDILIVHTLENAVCEFKIQYPLQGMRTVCLKWPELKICELLLQYRRARAQKQKLNCVIIWQQTRSLCRIATYTGPLNTAAAASADTLALTLLPEATQYNVLRQWQWWWWSSA